MTFQNGAIVAYSVSPDFHPKTPTQLQAIARQHGVPEAICPDYAGDRAMVGRAMGGSLAKAKAAGWLVQPLAATSTSLTYTIARIDKDIERERTDYTHDDVVKWTSEGGHGGQVEGSHAVARHIDAAYQALRGLVLAGDWTKNLIDYIVGECQGTSLKDNGHVWWVPPPGVAKLTALRAMLAEVGLALFVSEIAAENVGDVRQVAQRGLSEQIEELRADVAGFDGSQAPSVYKHRLGQLSALRQKALAYQAAVGGVYDEVVGLLGAVEQRVREQLTVRVNTVIKKDGTRETKTGPSLAAQLAYLATLDLHDEQALARAVVDGTLGVDVARGQRFEALHTSSGHGEGLDTACRTEHEATHAGPGESWGALMDALDAPAPSSELPTTW